MSNPFDQFDQNASGGNPFDQFDGTQPPSKVGYGEDVVKGLGSGLAEGLTGLVTMPFGVGSAVMKRAVGDYQPSDNWTDAAKKFGSDVIQPSEDVNKSLGIEYSPQTLPGKIAKTAMQVLPVSGPGKKASIGMDLAQQGISALKNAVASGAASEGFGELAKGTAAEPVARLAGFAAGSAALERAIAPAIKGTGNLLVKSAQNQKSGFVKDLLTPKETPTVAADMFSRSKEQGPLNSRVVQPTTQEQNMIDTVSQLPVGKNKSMLANYNVISDANDAEAQSLQAKLKANDVQIPDDHIINKFVDIRNDLGKSPYITGDGAKAAEKVMSIAIDNITKNDRTASGLLQARKDFDREIKRLKGDKTFDPAVDTPVTTAVQKIRQGINDMVANAVPSADVRASLDRQSNMYRAMDNIETKGASEGKNLVSRFAQKAADLIPVKSAIAKAALATGVAGVGAVAPAITAGGLGLYGVGRALNNPTVKGGLGRTLQTVGDALGPSTQNIPHITIRPQSYYDNLRGRP